MKSFYKELQAIDDRERKGYYNMHVHCLTIPENTLI